MRMTRQTETPVRSGAQSVHLFTPGPAPTVTDSGRFQNRTDKETLTRYLRTLAEITHVLLLTVIVVAHPIWVVCVFLLVFCLPTAVR
jgi:hypothetical protein